MSELKFGAALESGLGLKLAYLLKTNCGIYIPEFHSLWLHDFYRNRLNIDASFVGIGAAGGVFSNIGPEQDRNAWDIGASITCMVNRNFSILLNYDYERSSNYFSHQGLIKLSYDF